MTVYKLRISGSNDYISKIDPKDRTVHPPGSTESVQCISNPDAMWWSQIRCAEMAARIVENIEGFNMSVEPFEEE